MWIYSKIGFFSAVADHYRPGFVVVRARFRRDIAALCRLAGEVAGETPQPQRTPQRDYLWRISIGNVLWGRMLARLVEDIDYTNFKGAVHGDPVRDRAYGRCWSAMREAQDEAMRCAPGTPRTEGQGAPPRHGSARASGVRPPLHRLEVGHEG